HLARYAPVPGRARAGGIRRWVVPTPEQRRAGAHRRPPLPDGRPGVHGPVPRRCHRRPRCARRRRGRAHRPAERRAPHRRRCCRMGRDHFVGRAGLVAGEAPPHLPPQRRRRTYRLAFETRFGWRSDPGLDPGWFAFETAIESRTLPGAIPILPLIRTPYPTRAKPRLEPPENRETTPTPT